MQKEKIEKDETKGSPAAGDKFQWNLGADLPIFHHALVKIDKGENAYDKCIEKGQLADESQGEKGFEKYNQKEKIDNEAGIIGNQPEGREPCRVVRNTEKYRGQNENKAVHRRDIQAGLGEKEQTARLGVTSLSRPCGQIAGDESTGEIAKSDDIDFPVEECLQTEEECLPHL